LDKTRLDGIYTTDCESISSAQPQNLAKWSPFPKNCWVGVSVCNDEMLSNAVNYLEDIEANKFISAEPLLGRLLDLGYGMYYSGIKWLIIGQQTPASIKTQPKIEWIKEIIDAADRENIPVFLKDNLYPLLSTETVMGVPRWAGCSTPKALRQEFPNV
jgi:protein gp37